MNSFCGTNYGYDRQCQRTDVHTHCVRCRYPLDGCICEISALGGIALENYWWCDLCHDWHRGDFE